MKKLTVVLLVLVSLFGLLPSVEAEMCFDSPCIIASGATMIYGTGRKPAPFFRVKRNDIVYEYYYLSRTAERQFEIRANIWKDGVYVEISDDIIKVYFEKDSIFDLALGYKLQMLELRGNSLVFKLINP